MKGIVFLAATLCAFFTTIFFIAPCLGKPLFWPAIYSYRAGDWPTDVTTGDFDGNGLVDFDDFFLFADNFGKSSTDPGFDPGFDLNMSGVVDFDDFFVFADNFGKSSGEEG